VRRGDEGQASLELLGLLPLCLIVALACAQLLAAGAARVAAGSAAEAGAMALLQGGDPPRAARAAAPGWSKARLHVAVDGRRVSARIVPIRLLPGVAKLLTAHASADAGPAA
jgi:hypothetical protein